MGPATDSLDHRTGVCYFLSGLLYNELCHAVGMRSLSVPPSALLNILYTESIKAYIAFKQKQMYFAH